MNNITIEVVAPDILPACVNSRHVPYKVTVPDADGFHMFICHAACEALSGIAYAPRYVVTFRKSAAKGFRKVTLLPGFKAGVKCYGKYMEFTLASYQIKWFCDNSLARFRAHGATGSFYVRVKAVYPTMTTCGF